MNTVINIGIDVHKDSYSLCVYTLGNSQASGRMRMESRATLGGGEDRQEYRRAMKPQCAVVANGRIFFR